MRLGEISLWMISEPRDNMAAREAETIKRHCLDQGEGKFNFVAASSVNWRSSVFHLIITAIY